MKISNLAEPLPRVINNRFPDAKVIEDLRLKGIDRDSLIAIAKEAVYASNGVSSPALIKDLQTLLTVVSKTNLVYVKKPSARITVKNFDYLQVLEEFEDIFWDQVFSKQPISIGNIIFSAMRYGALLNKREILLFMYLLPQKINSYTSIYWYDLIDDEGAANRWFPDSLTLSLIASWKKQKQDGDLHNDWALHLKETGFKGLSASKLIEACATALSLSVPSALIDTAKGISDTRPLHPDVFHRLITKKTPKLIYSKEIAIPDVVSSNSKINVKGGAVGSGVLDNELFLKTGRLLRNPERKGAELKEDLLEIVKQYERQCTPIAVLLCEWSAIRLSESGYWGNKFSPSTAYTKRGSIRKLACHLFGTINIIELSEDELLDGYLEIIDCAESISQKSKLAKSLQDFHYFLQKYHDVPEIESPPWQEFFSGQKNVDSKVVWPHEYRRAINYLFAEYENEVDESKKQRLNRCAIALILGYRCGMRRTEIRLLKSKDVVGTTNLEILVRPYLKYKLKSTSSNRRIPCSVLLTPRELKFLKGWKKKVADSYYFLPDSEDENNCLTNSYLFDPIQDLLRQVTGDPFARFHHLRHSFATINFLRWLLNSTRNRFCVLMHEPDIFIEKQCDLILGRGVKSKQRVLHALSAMLGHSGPEMTLQHYIHSSDVALRHYCEASLPKLTQDELGRVLNIKGRQVRKQKLIFDEGFEQVMGILAKRIAPFTQPLNVSDWRYEGSGVLGLDSNISLLQDNKYARIWIALSYVSGDHFDSFRLAERFSVNNGELLKAIDCVKILMSLKHTDSVHRTYRHQPKSWGSNKRLFYSLPKNKKDEASIVRILSSYEKLTDSDKLRVKKSLHYFVHHSRESDPNIQFKDNSKLADFLRLFQLLKLNHIVKGKELPAYRLTLSHRYENGSPERFNAWRYWEETSGILPEYKSNRTKKSYPAEHGLLGLSVLSKKPKTSSRVGARRQASWGFRLGLYVLSVIELSPEQLATYDVVM